MRSYNIFLYYRERYWPLIAAITASLLFYKYQFKINDLDKLIDKLLETSLAINGALLGFLLTILTIINTITTRRMNFVKTGGAFNTLNGYLKVALWFDLISISVFFIFPLINSYTSFKDFDRQLYTSLVALISYTWFLNIRFSLIFIKLLTDPDNS